MSSELGIDFFLVFVLIIFQLIVLGIFITLYVRKKQAQFLALIVSVSLFIFSNSLTLGFIQTTANWLQFLLSVLNAGGLAAIVVFLEIFDTSLAFTPRSSGSIIFIMFVGAVKGAQSLFGSNVGSFVGFMAPMMFILIGTFYLNTLRDIKKRIRFENQKKKIRSIKLGVYLTFIIPKFFIGAIIALSTLPAFLTFLDIFSDYDTAFLREAEFEHMSNTVLNLIQTIGLVVMSLPIIYSNSVFFMQSRKVSRLIVIDKESTPVFEFHFEAKEKSQYDEDLLNETYMAMGAIMNRGRSSGNLLTKVNFDGLEIMTEIRGDFAVLLIADRQTKFLRKSLIDFADDFEKIYPKNSSLNQIRIQKLKYTAEKMIQKNFGLEQEEFEQIMQLVSIGYDKMANKYLESRSMNDPEIKLLPDFMKRLPVGAKVLDAGCGAGEPITRILSEKFKVTGVDISRKQIDIARDNLPYCEFVWQDMTTLTYPDNYFDGIVSYYAIPHVPREEHMSLLENFYRMLKPNGIVLVCFGTSDEPGVVVDDFFGVKMYWSSFDAGTNIEMLKEVGFHVLELKLIFDDTTEEQHIFIMAQKIITDFLEEIKEFEFDEVAQDSE
ncbi:MAG: methyltransferase domain-containing protein [Candidatus Heimdallarchaeota archaeon]|nr:methyltransferase domain-containing protein [Candidatus Heimdallarchaeota archaeon]